MTGSAQERSILTATSLLSIGAVTPPFTYREDALRLLDGASRPLELAGG